jgi:hypothetical protein
MTEARRDSKIFGLVGAVCLAIFWTARFVPDLADTFAVSTFGKFALFGTIPTAIVLATIAAVRGSKWWLALAVASVVTPADVWVRLSPPVQ